MKSFFYKSIFLLLLLLSFSFCKSSKKTSQAKQPTAKESQDSILIKKYVGVLKATPEEIGRSLKLYQFIDLWLKTPFSKEPGPNSVNDLTFAQKLYEQVYGRKLPETYSEIYQSKLIPKFLDRTYLAEGDLIFFEQKSKTAPIVEMIGVYLHNNKFICPSAHTGGVVITSFEDPYWKQCYKLSGRLK